MKQIFKKLSHVNTLRMQQRLRWKYTIETPRDTTPGDTTPRKERHETLHISECRLYDRLNNDSDEDFKDH